MVQTTIGNVRSKSKSYPFRSLASKLGPFRIFLCRPDFGLRTYEFLMTHPKFPPVSCVFRRTVRSPLCTLRNPNREL